MSVSAPPPIYLAFSVSKFCEAHNVSKSFVYAQIAAGIGPAIMKVGKRTLISSESAAEWRQRMTAATLQKQRPAAK